MHILNHITNSPPPAAPHLKLHSNPNSQTHSSLSLALSLPNSLRAGTAQYGWETCIIIAGASMNEHISRVGVRPVQLQRFNITIIIIVRGASE